MSVADDRLIQRLDAAIHELQLIRAELAAAMPATSKAGDIITGFDADDLSDGNLIDSHQAQERFGYPADTIRKWCRTEGLGVRRGGRWMVSVPKLRRHLNGG